MVLGLKAGNVLAGGYGGDERDYNYAIVLVWGQLRNGLQSRDDDST